MATQQDVIKTLMKSLDTSTSSGVTALNAAIKSASSNKFSTAQAVIDKMVSDCKKAGDADTFLKDYCGIILDNDDTGAITGSDAGGSKTKTAESIVPESGSLKSFSGDSFSTNGLTFELSYVEHEPSYYDGHAYDRSYSSLSSSEKFIWQSLYTWWGKESLNLISNSYGSNFGFGSSSSATVKNIHVGFYDVSDNTLAYVRTWSYTDGTAADLDLMVNMNYYDDVDTSDPNGSTSVAGAGYLDRTIAHEFTHAVMSANITNFSQLPKFIKEGMAELTHGIDDERYYNIKSIAGNASSLSSALNLSSSGGSGDAYSGGYMFLRYFAKQAAGSDTVSSDFTQGADYYENTTSNVTLKALGGNDTVDNSDANNVKIYGNNGNDTLRAYDDGNKVTLSGDAGNDCVYFYAAITNSRAYGGAGKDSLYSGAVNATISGDAGNDFVHIYANGKKNIVNGGAGNDTIEGGGQKSTINGGAGNDYFSGYSNDINIRINGGAGNDTIKDGGVKSTVDGGTGNDYLYLYTNATNTKVIGGTGKDSIYSGATKSSLSGGAGNDYIHLYTEATNTTVNGGTGNDTIKSYSSSTTTYIYKNGDGKDVIDGFNFGTDKIRLTSGSVKSKKTSGNDVILTVGSGSIRIKNGKGKKITVVNSSGKSTTYTVGKSTATTNSDVSQLWFDNDSLSADAYGQTLDNITGTNSSIASSIDDISNTITNPVTSTPTGPITPTKYVVYADKSKIA